jgi:2,3-bisphosphoglycerate-dependent phosphoglycerate mutase
LKQNGFTFDIGYTSVLKRAIKTLSVIQEELNNQWNPIHKLFQLNGKMFGELQGLTKAEIIEKYGETNMIVK